MLAVTKEGMLIPWQVGAGRSREFTTPRLDQALCCTAATAKWRLDESQHVQADWHNIPVPGQYSSCLVRPRQLNQATTFCEIHLVLGTGPLCGQLCLKLPGTILSHYRHWSAGDCTV